VISMGSRVPYRNPASGIWHVGRIVGRRCTPNPDDLRTFTRLDFSETCGCDDVEPISGVLRMLLRAKVPDVTRLCHRCYRGGLARDGAQSPDCAANTDNWREALLRQSDGVMWCPACRSMTTEQVLDCITCGEELEQGNIRRLRETEND